jgi:hypothetical protein
MHAPFRPVTCKRPITEDDIVLVIDSIGTSHAHDDILFLCMLTNGRDGLLRLGEMTMPDSVRLRNTRKLSLRHTVRLYDDRYSYFLPYHKADRFYEGNTIIIQRTTRRSNPHSFFRSYLASRDALFPSSGCALTGRCQHAAGSSRESNNISLATSRVNPSAPAAPLHSQRPVSP